MLPCRREHRFLNFNDFGAHLNFLPQVEAKTASKNPQEHPCDLPNRLCVDQKSQREHPESRNWPHTYKKICSLSILSDLWSPKLPKSIPNLSEIAPRASQTIKNHSPDHQKPPPDKSETIQTTETIPRTVRDHPDCGRGRSP